MFKVSSYAVVTRKLLCLLLFYVYNISFADHQMHSHITRLLIFRLGQEYLTVTESEANSICYNVINPLPATVAIWIQLESILCQTRLSCHL